MTNEKELRIASLDDIFSTEDTRQYDAAEKVEDIRIEDIHQFPNHPFQVREDEKLMEMVESIKENGVLMPTLVRPREGGGYEMVSGHRRRYASALAGKETVPAIVRNLTDDEATIIMVDSNIQRENILPSEKAFAYKMKLDAIKHQGKATSRPVGDKLISTDLVAKDFGDSQRTVQRYIRLTYLYKPILDMVDENKIAIRPAVEISYLPKQEQEYLMDAMELNDATPSLPQAMELRKLYEQGVLESESFEEVLSQAKPNQVEKVTFKKNDLNKYFPKSYSQKDMQDTIVKLLEKWAKSREAAKGER